MTFSLRDILHKATELSAEITERDARLIKLFLEEFPKEIVARIDQHIIEIAKDGHINLQDIPELILFLTDILCEPVVIPKTITPFEIIDFLLKVVIEFGDVFAPEIDKIAAARVVSASLNLLQTVISRRRAGGAQKWFCCV